MARPHCLLECFDAGWKIQIGCTAIELVALGFRKSDEFETLAAIELQQTGQHLSAKCPCVHEKDVRNLALIQSLRNAPIVIDTLTGRRQIAVFQYFYCGRIALCFASGVWFGESVVT